MAPRPGPNDPLSDDEDTIKQQLLPLLKTEDAVDDFTEDEQFTKYTGFGSNNIQISFPGFFDWLKHYDRHPSNAPARAKFSAYQRAKADAENRIKDDLKKIHSSQSGGALFKEIGRARDQTLTIAAREPKKGTDDEGPDDDDDAQNGNGTDVTIRFGSALIEPNEFTARFPWMMAPAAQRDEILFHELVHAASDMNGVTRDRHVNMFFDGESEFLAIAIANLYI
jgi:hypothetical protein